MLRIPFIARSPRRRAPPARALWDRSREGPAAPGPPLALASTICRQRDFDAPYFRAWVARFAQPFRYHRALWEWVYVAEMLRQGGALAPGSTGIGFGVGREALPAAFASFGCAITATDLAPREAAESGWAGGTQYAGRLELLKNADICADAVVERLVRFRAVDMRAIPGDLAGFDFCWSCCALEHLGSIAAGLNFVERSLDVLRPGGIAVHTTEYNVSSNRATLEEGPTVLFRARDLRRLVGRLEQAGHAVAPLDLAPGDLVLDRFVDLPPYEAHEPHLVLAFMGHTTTSVALVVRKAASRDDRAAPPLC